MAGNIELLEFMIENGLDDFSYAMRGACEGANLDVYNYIVEKLEYNNVQKYCKNYFYFIIFLFFYFFIFLFFI